jgi:uncharacterized repeat protein (TIGR01451 family)
MWRYAAFRNNLFLGTRYAFEFTTAPDVGWRDFDYDAWGTTRAIDPGDPYFKWDNVRYDRLPDLQAIGVEVHGVEAAFEHLQDAALPAWWDQPVEPGSRDLRLVDGAPEVDAGVDLPNLNDAFPLSGLPDVGAFEYGQPLPPYGPRPWAPDLGPSAKWPSRPAASWGQTITYTLAVRNDGAPLSGTIYLSDTVPAGLGYVAGTLTATLGLPDDGAAPLLRWSGVLSGTSAATVTYAVTVSVSLPQTIRNTATISAGPAGTITRTATIVVNGSGVFLPLVLKGASP